MRNMTFAAGLAAGYVLGARAGRDRYEQIAKSARRVAGHPAVVQAQSKVKSMVGAGVDAVTAKVGSGATGDEVTFDGTA
jgi:tryptophan synthase beta subunit